MGNFSVPTCILRTKIVIYRLPIIICQLKVVTYKLLMVICKSKALIYNWSLYKKLFTGVTIAVSQ